MVEMVQWDMRVRHDSLTFVLSWERRNGFLPSSSWLPDSIDLKNSCVTLPWTNQQKSRDVAREKNAYPATQTHTRVWLDAHTRRHSTLHDLQTGNVLESKKSHGHKAACEAITTQRTDAEKEMVLRRSRFENCCGVVSGEAFFEFSSDQLNNQNNDSVYSPITIACGLEPWNLHCWLFVPQYENTKSGSRI